MAITIPTVDEFTESTVMLVIREIAEYICGNNGLVAQINNNDITGFTSSYTDNVLKIDATKGDGSKLPVCNVTIEGGGSSTGNPYPTAVSGTVGADGNITFTITMSSGAPLTTTINMNYFASTADLSDLQKQVTGLKLTSSGNTMSINGTNAPIVNSISGSVNNGNLKISVNGIESVDIPLPKSGVSVINMINLTVNSTKSIKFTVNKAINIQSGGNFSGKFITTKNTNLENIDKYAVAYVDANIPVTGFINESSTPLTISTTTVINTTSGTYYNVGNDITIDIESGNDSIVWDIPVGDYIGYLVVFPFSPGPGGIWFKHNTDINEIPTINFHYDGNTVTWEATQITLKRDNLVSSAIGTQTIKNGNTPISCIKKIE